MTTDDLIINRVRSYSSGTTGRILNNVRQHHFIVDEPTLGEAMTPGDHFISGVSACGAGLIEMVAQQEGIPLTRIEVTTEAVRNRADTSVFVRVDMRFALSGVTREQAEHLVETYTRR
jgi:uncharacterized OsmC-like protein